MLYVCKHTAKRQDIKSCKTAEDYTECNAVKSVYFHNQFKVIKKMAIKAAFHRDYDLLLHKPCSQCKRSQLGALHLQHQKSQFQ